MNVKKDVEKKLLDEVSERRKEHPYKIPENWIWSTSLELFNIQYGKGLPTSKLLDKGYPVYGANGRIGFYSEYTQEQAQVLMTCRGATCGTINLSEPKSFITNNSMVLKPKWDADINFIKYLFLSLDRGTLISGSAQPQITIKAFENFHIPVPPLNEQKLIAEKVEYLINKVDEAKYLLKEAKDSFKLRRAAILDKAFQGELTEKWRNENIVDHGTDKLLAEIQKEKENHYLELVNKNNEGKGKKPSKQKKFNNMVEQGLELSLPAEWACCTLGDVIYDFKYGTSEKSDYNFSGTPVIRIPNIGEENINISDMKFLKEDLIDYNAAVLEGDILIVRSNGSKELVGKCSIVRKNEEKYSFASYLIRMRPILVNPEFILWLLKSDRIREQFFSKSKSSAGINNINTEELATTVIPLPSVLEQKEIVRILKVLLNKEEELRNLLNLDSRLNTLRNSILSKAFRGELGTNDPTEKSAIELLKEVLQEKVK